MNWARPKAASHAPNRPKVKSTRRSALLLVLATFSLAVLLVVISGRGSSPLEFGAPLEALPLYAARAGRACDNCHADPSRWTNPELSLRKCNLSCMTCHINPTGGGLRTVAGRYYAQATLPMFWQSHRPYEDRNRYVPFLELTKSRGNRLWDPAWGKPVGGSAPLAFVEDRYNGLRADPLLLVGIDLRFAFYRANYQDPEEAEHSAASLLFPMQLDVHSAITPYRHVTLLTTAGVLAKSKGFSATFERDTPFMVKDIMLLFHQLPYMSYVKVGRFIPQFGTYLDDHTTPTRRDFELEQGLQTSRVTGVEVGLAPNYPYASVALFRPNERDQFSADDPDNDKHPPFVGVNGWGLAASAGWRDLGWQAGISGMLRHRSLADGGKTESVAFNWAFNPWHYVEWLPLTYLGEVAIGSRRRGGSGKRLGHIAAFHELAALLRNGINLRLKYDFADPDSKIADDHYHRLSVGGDVVLLPFLSYRLEYRLRFANGRGRVNTSDLFMVVRSWY